MSLQSAVYGFVPTSITGCQVWLDGMDSSTVSFSSGSNVSSWSDKSGNGRNATVYAGTPTYTSALGMTFNGSSSLQITYTASPTIETMFVIVKFNSVSGQGDILSGTASGQREYLMYFPYSPGTIYLGRHSTAPSGAINGGTVTTGSNYLLGYVFNGTGNTISFYQSGNTITSGTPQFTYSAGGTISVIGSYNGGGYLQGQIYEMIIYSTALSTTERQQVEGYLAQKWGLTSSLPSSHPGRATTLYRSDYTKQNVMTALPYYAAFSPRQISGLGLWLDGADPAGNGVLPANGATVSTWVDKSGNANNGTSGTATFNRDSVGGFINFTGSQTYSITNPNVVVNQYFTIFVVEQLQNYAGGEAAFMGGNGSFNANLHMRYTTGGGGMKFGFFGNDLDASVTAFLTNSTQPVRIWSFSFLPSSRVIYLNGTSIGSDTNNIQISGWGGAAIGAMVSYGGQYYNGKMREVMIFSGSLLTAQRQQIESYLAQKWGLTASLPGGHLQATQPAGAITPVASANFRIFVRLRTFLPTSIAGLQMWMDAADSSSDSMTLSGSTVTVWKDKSGLGNHTTARSGTSTLTSNAINGKSAISMAGGYFTGPFATANTGTQVHAFAVMTIDSSSGLWPRPLALGRPGVNDFNESTTTFAIIRYSGTQAVGIGRAGQYLSVGIPAYSSPFLVQSSHNGATEYMSVNGNLTVSSAGTGQSGNFNITSYGLGVNTNTGDYFALNGYYGEVMYFNVQLSDANRQKIEGYLAWKWGLQALLPGGHPHASAAP